MSKKLTQANRDHRRIKNKNRKEIIMKKILSIILTALMLTASFSMLVVPASAADNASPVITPDASWYDANATTLVINDAADLMAFALQLEAKNTFYGKTVELAADVDLNPGWTASETAPTNVWPYKTVAAEGFWGTFDGKGHTISGIYNDFNSIQAGIFGNYATRPNTRLDPEDSSKYIIHNIMIKNVAIVNSVQIVRGQDTGGFYGYVAQGVSNDNLNYTTINFENVYNGISLYDLAASSNNKAGTAFCLGGFVGNCNSSGIVLNFKNCVYAGNMKFDTMVNDKVGGFVGTTGTTQKDVVATTYENCAYYGNADIGADFFACFSADGIRKDIVKNCVSAGVMKSSADPMELITGALVHQKNTGTTVTGCLYTTTNGLNVPFGEEVSVAPEGTTFCTHAELIGANAKTPAEGWTKTAGYAMPTSLYTQLKTLIDAQTPIVPDGTELGGGEQNDDKKEETPDNNKKEETETKAPETEAETTAAVTEKVEEGGCGGVIGVGAVAIVGAAAIAVARKKKED